MSKHEDNAARCQYERLKQKIDSDFPAGRFVAVEASQIIADGATHQEVVEKLAALGKSPQGMLIVQAGAEYPDSATILMTSLGRAGDA